MHSRKGGNDPDAVAWNNDNSGGTTHRVRDKQANGFGLYDMSGNVLEWLDNCWDGNCVFRVIRGGSWIDISADTRATVRNGQFASYLNHFIGFRVARLLP